MTFLGGLLLLFLAVGIGRWLLPRREDLERSRLEELALSYLLGLAAIVTAGTLCLAIGVPFGLFWWLPLGGGLAAWAMWWRRRQTTGICAPSSFSRPTAIILLLLAAGSVAASLALPLNEFDPIYHFAYRGQVLLYDGTATGEAITGMIQPDGFGRLVTHPNYPFGIPILEAWVAKLGGWDARWVQLPLAWWTACLPLVVAFGLRRRGAKAASLGALLMAVTPMLYGADYLKHGWADISRAGLAGEMMLGGGGDLAVACFFGAALALWLRLHDRRTWQAMLPVALCLAGAAQMKNEGLALAGCTLLALTLGLGVGGLARLRREGKPLLYLAPLTMLLLAPWLGLRGQLPAIDENYTERLTPSMVATFWSSPELQDKSPQAAAGKVQDDGEVHLRRDYVAASFLEEFLDWRSWGLLWLLALLALPLTPQRFRDVQARQLALLLLGVLLLYFLILLVTPWNFPSLRDKGIPERLLVHLVGVMGLLIGSALAPPTASAPAMEEATS